MLPCSFQLRQEQHKDFEKALFCNQVQLKTKCEIKTIQHLKGENQKTAYRSFCSLDPEFKENNVHIYKTLQNIIKGLCLPVFHMECLSMSSSINVNGLVTAYQTNEVCINEMLPLL